MDILLFTERTGKAEYFSLKLKSAGHNVMVAETLPAVHRTLRVSDPDFVIVDSETFPEPDYDYRSIIKRYRRKFLLFFDNELSHPRQVPGKEECLALIAETLTEIKISLTLSDSSFSARTAEERRFLKENGLRPSHAVLLGCLLRNWNTDIASATLSKLLWSDSGKTHQQTLYAYMNQLRILLERRNVPLIIEKRMKGTYRLCCRHKKSCPDDKAASSVLAAKPPETISGRRRFFQEPSCGQEALQCSSWHL